MCGVWKQKDEVHCAHVTRSALCACPCGWQGQGVNKEDEVIALWVFDDGTRNPAVLAGGPMRPRGAAPPGLSLTLKQHTTLCDGPLTHHLKPHPGRRLYVLCNNALPHLPHRFTHCPHTWAVVPLHGCIVQQPHGRIACPRVWGRLNPGRLNP